MSRGGYRKLEKKLIQANLKKLEEAAKSDPSIVVQPPPPPSRHRKWKAGRIKGEKYINPIVADVAGRIDELEEQSSQGSFTQTGRMDILATAIGKLDHPGQVRGEPRGIGLSRYFGRSSQSHFQSEPSREFTAKIREELRAELREEMRQSLRQELRDELLHELRGEMRSMVLSSMQGGMGDEGHRSQESPAFPSTKGSYNPPEIGHSDPGPSLEAGEPCCLLLDIPFMRVVAEAIVYTHATTHHHKQIWDNQCKVNVTSVGQGGKV